MDTQHTIQQSYGLKQVGDDDALVCDFGYLFSVFDYYSHQIQYVCFFLIQSLY